MKIIEYQIPESNKSQFNEFANKFAVDPYKDQSYYLKVMEGKVEEIFPQDLQKILKEMGKSGDPSIILIKGMPIDEVIPEKETVEQRSEAKTKVSEKLMFGTVSFNGL